MNTSALAARRWLPRLLLACSVLALGACAPLERQPNEYQVGRTRLNLPAGDWEDLGTADTVYPLPSQPGGSIALQARTLVLHGPKKEVLAVLRVQTNRGNFEREDVLWTGNCPRQQGMDVEDARSGSNVRVDCLRMKRWADGAWMDKHQSEWAQWLAGRKLAPLQPASYISYRYGMDRGALVVVDAWVVQNLLRPPTRNSHEFLVAGRPAKAWTEALAQAARQSTGMMDGTFTIPPFPVPAAPRP